MTMKSRTIILLLCACITNGCASYRDLTPPAQVDATADKHPNEDIRTGDVVRITLSDSTNVEGRITGITTGPHTYHLHVSKTEFVDVGERHRFDSSGEIAVAADSCLSIARRETDPVKTFGVIAGIAVGIALIIYNTFTLY